MNVLVLVWGYLKARPLNSALNIFLLALGIAVVSILIVTGHQLHEKISSNSRGIDLVVGAKGSPMQLILANVFHADFPTGNISLAEAERIARNRLVRTAIPIALGDSYRGFRIVGTTREYAELYNGEINAGSWWSRPMEVTLGASVADVLKLSAGKTFTSSHGLAKTGHAHEGQEFIVVGTLDKTNTVLDDLILTSVESIWKVHEHETAGDSLNVNGNGHVASIGTASSLIPSVPAGDSTKEITSLLIRYRSAMGAVQLPRWVNGQSSLQAASPAFESARLFSILGVGLGIVNAFAYLLIFISALSIFIALYNSLKERKYDLAIMRSMGASRSKIFLSVLLEGSVLTFLGTVVGLALSHSILFLFGTFVEEAERAGVTGSEFYREEGIILVSSLLLGALCAMLPAMQAYRTDISKVLASG
jgi:putative ABC transport system permease protein